MTDTNPSLAKHADVAYVTMQAMQAAEYAPAPFREWKQHMQASVDP